MSTRLRTRVWPCLGLLWGAAACFEDSVPQLYGATEVASTGQGHLGLGSSEGATSSSSSAGDGGTSTASTGAVRPEPATSSSTSDATTTGESSTTLWVASAGSSSSAGEGSSAGSSSDDGATPTCGNGELDPGELCDGGAGCTDCVLDGFPCNPIHDAGCPEGQRCTYTGIVDEPFACRDAVDAPGGLDASCSDLYASHECAAGHLCVLECRDFCCRPWCETTGRTPCAVGTCEGFWLDSSGFLGLHFLGVCE